MDHDREDSFYNPLDEQLVDPKAEMKEKRGKTLPVLCVLSYVSIGYTAINSIFAFARGKLSAAEVDEIRVQAMDSLEEDMPQMAVDIVMDSMEYAVLANEKFFLLNGLSLLIAAIGFLGVYMMYKLNKTGYYIYVAYSILPIVMQLTLFPGNLIAKFVSFFIGFFSILFLVLYGVQLKRME
ncbi:MAG: hypothetical protein HUJ25_07415 [Crocinitomicaceae bacterium]|nr:hypothetical protein [Crocinitomicaceae bacterium]